MGVPLTSTPMANAIITFTQGINQIINSWGYMGLFVFTLLASVLPIPSEIILPFAGYLVYRGEFIFWLTVVVSTMAAVVGALINYYIGLKGIEVLTKYRILGRHIFSERQIKVATNWFNKYGVAMIFFGHMVPVIKTVISFPAGAVKMPLTKFVIYTGAGSLIWNILLIYGGYYLGSKYSDIAGAIDYLLIIVVIVLISAGSAFLIRRRIKEKRKKRESVYIGMTA
jgi:membrane protein DedA with SNARE-associated domain